MKKLYFIADIDMSKDKKEVVVEKLRKGFEKYITDRAEADKAFETVDKSHISKYQEAPLQWTATLTGEPLDSYYSNICNMFSYSPEEINKAKSEVEFEKSVRSQIENLLEQQHHESYEQKPTDKISGAVITTYGRIIPHIPLSRTVHVKNVQVKPLSDKTTSDFNPPKPVNHLFFRLTDIDRFVENTDVKSIQEIVTELEKTAIKIGKKETEGKLFYEFDWDFIEACAKRMQSNKSKYEKFNWKKPMDVENLKQSLYRHVMEIMKGNYKDGEDNLGHLYAGFCNLMMIEYQLKNNLQESK